MKLQEVILSSGELVKVITEGINQGKMSLKRAEETIVRFINRIGQIMIDEVVERIDEPVEDNGVMVNGEEAVFSEVRNLRFYNRFGGQTVRARRCSVLISCYFKAENHDKISRESTPVISCI